MPKLIDTLKQKDVTHAYRGKPGCACGCRGNYYYRKSYAERAGEERGYPVNPDEISDATVNRIYDRVMDCWETGSVLEDNYIESNDTVKFVSVEVGTRVYTLYF